MKSESDLIKAVDSLRFNPSHLLQILDLPNSVSTKELEAGLAKFYAKYPPQSHPELAKGIEEAIGKLKKSGQVSREKLIPVSSGPQVKILEKIGEGGTSTVYRALKQDGSIVALRVRERVPADDDRTRVGSTLWASLSHPNITRLHEFGLLKSGNETHSYVIVEYMPGGTLRDRLWRGISLHAGMRTLLEVGAALLHAHSRGVYHCDIKPENILYDEGGVAKLTDFGNSQREDGLGYFEPSTWPARIPDKSGGPLELDTFQFSVLAYEVLTGKLMVDKRMLWLRYEEELLPPHLLNQCVSTNLSDHIHRAIITMGTSPSLHAIFRLVQRDTLAIRNNTANRCGNLQITSDWQHFLSEDLLTVHGLGFEQSSVGVGGCYSSDLGSFGHFWTYDEEHLKSLWDSVAHSGRKIDSHKQLLYRLNIEACAKFMAGRLDDALRTFLEVSEQASAPGIVKYNAVVTMLKLGRYNDAEEYANRLEGSGVVTLESRMAQIIAYSASNPGKARELALDLLLEWNTENPNEPHHHIVKVAGIDVSRIAAYVCYRARDYKSAYKFARNAVHLGSLT